jgi:DNA-binding SARP family transcriptional activator
MANQNELKIFLLGSPRLIWNDQPLMISRRQVRALLYRLAASLKPVTREELYALLWPEKTDMAARRNLSRLIAYLRQELPDPELVQVTHDTVSLDVGRVWCDLSTLLDVDSSGPDQKLESVLSLVDERFLEGFYLPDNLLFEDWLLEVQREVEQKVRDILDVLVARKTASGIMFLPSNLPGRP